MALRRLSIPVPTTPSALPAHHVTLRDTPPDRYDVIRDSDSAVLATFTQGCRTVPVLGRTRSLVEQIKSEQQDDFDRTVVDGWGSTNSAGVWAVRTGAASDFQVTPGAATMSAAAANTSKRIAPSSYGYDYSTADVKALVAANQAPAGDSLYQGIMVAYQDSDNHYLAMLEFLSVAMAEAFGTNVSNGWGTEDTRAKTWTSTGTAADYSAVAAGPYGQHSHTNLNSSRRSTVDAVESDNGEVLMSVIWPTQPTGGSFFCGPILRYTDISNQYTIRLRKNYASDVLSADLDCQKTVAGTVSTIATASVGVQIPANEKWWIRAQIYGDAIKARAWKDGTAEPSTWLLDFTDASLVTGSRFGVRSITSTSLSNTLPIAVRIPSWQFTTKGDVVRLLLQKRIVAVTTNLAAPYNVSNAELVYREALSEQWWIRALRSGTDLKGKAWKGTLTEPAGYQAAVVDAAFSTGDVGLRAIANSGYTGTLPVVWSWAQYWVTALWSNPTTITHDTWVYVLPAPYDHAAGFDEAWLNDRLRNLPEDVLGMVLEYVSNAPPVLRRTTASPTAVPDTGVPVGTHAAGDSQYSPRRTGAGDGGRTAGSDYNDYLGVDIAYPQNPSGTATDNNEPTEFICLDCSGFTRMIMGWRNGIPLQNSVQWQDRIPRVSPDIAIDTHTPGVILFQHATRPSAGELAKLQPGDHVSFDADTTDPTEEEGEIDHDGFYLGIDTDGDRRFISSRKTANGPTFSDIGGSSVLAASPASNLYSRSLRVARRF